MLHQVYLLLGTNQGDRLINLQQAMERLGDGVGTIQVCSSIYETAAWGKTDQPNFLNQAIALQTHFNPHELLQVLQKIEITMGRIKVEHWGERIIDIDIIFYDDVVLQDKNLNLPHKEMHQRRFVLVPLNEIASKVVHPLMNKTVGELLANLDDPLIVEPLNA